PGPRRAARPARPCGARGVRRRGARRARDAGAADRRGAHPGDPGARPPHRRRPGLPAVPRRARRARACAAPAAMIGAPMLPLLYPATVVALAVALLLLGLERRGDPATPTVGAALALLALAAMIVMPGGTARPPLVAGLVVALLAHDARDRLHTECALKLMWVMGAALALSWLGSELLVVATGTRDPAEQSGVLALAL